jgi:tetratricopeptide (TPR) repeat protein
MAGAYDTAWPRIEALVADFAGDEHLPWTLNELARQCETFEQPAESKYAIAKSLYQLVRHRWPEHKEASRAELETAWADALWLSDTDNSEAALQVMNGVLIDFQASADLPQVIYRTEEQYYMRLYYLMRSGAKGPYSKEYYLKPIVLWQNVLSKSPDFYYDNPDLYYFLACCYYQLGEYKGAVEYFGMVIDNWPDCRYASGAQMLIDECQERLGNTVK